MKTAEMNKADEITNSANSTTTAEVISKKYFVPFILVTTLFALWGFANDITNPMVAAFKSILLISHFESSLVQTAFYGGYCFMAIPAALFIKRFSYKLGILLGLALYVTGCLMFIPSGSLMLFEAFLLSYFIMTCGLSFLETTANPYILSMGDEETATRRLNFAQAFNPIGSLMGMFVAKEMILAKLDKTGDEERRLMAESNPESFKAIQQHDLDVIIGPYTILGLCVLAVLIIFALYKLPATANEQDKSLNIAETLKRLFTNMNYVQGVIAQMFYVGAQIMCWTFIIQYGVNELGLAREEAQSYNIVAMVIFVSSRFICTYMLKYISPGRLLMMLALGGGLFTLGAIFAKGMTGLYSLVAVSACMSLMFPTIYGIALKGLGDDAKLGSAGLILAIGGGCWLTPMQAAIMDMDGINIGSFVLTSTRTSFFLPFLCFLVIGVYGWRAFKRSRA